MIQQMDWHWASFRNILFLDAFIRYHSYYYFWEISDLLFQT
jgi:hypothetical protein